MDSYFATGVALLRDFTSLLPDLHLSEEQAHLWRAAATLRKYGFVFGRTKVFVIRRVKADEWLTAPQLSSRQNITYYSLGGVGARGPPAPASSCCNLPTGPGLTFSRPDEVDRLNPRLFGPGPGRPRRRPM